MANATPHVAVFDSDGNPIATFALDSADTPARLGTAIMAHWALVDATPGADEPHLVVMRTMIEPSDDWYAGTRS